MSLFDEFMTECIMLGKSYEHDGEGGFTEKYSESAAFSAAIVFNTSKEVHKGAKQGVTSLYTVTLPRGIKLEFHDVFKRLSDGKIFRVTSDSDDKVTPPAASFSFTQVTAEEWEL